MTRSQVQKLIKDSHILVNDKKVNQGYRVKKDDAITIEKPEDETDTLIPEPIPVKIFFMDDYLAVVDKPAGMVVYPAVGHKKGTLLNALAYYSKKLASIGAPLRPGVVHRLDKDTSGIMMVALDDTAYYDLIEQFEKRTIQRRYLAIVSGYLKKDSGEISLDIGRSASDRKKMSTKTKKGKEAITRWKVIKKLKNATLIEARLGTGRTHQIRVHFSAIGHPVLGDRIYGKKTFIEINKNKIHVPRQMLHAESLGFVHPITKEYLEFSSTLHEDMEECIEKLSD
ncbi:MAG: RNA pseudouridine synthase [Thermodesulfovibrio sp.]|nr:RNA pseudouridine synthase [Thermodesulfovibrio sp.]